MASSPVSRLSALFEGNPDGFGTYDAAQTEKNTAKGGKIEIKKTATTQRGSVTSKMWQDHIDGTTPLGIIPIRGDGTCRWGCIDVDKYDMLLPEIVKRVEELGLPLIVCRTKSGGAHLFLFLSGWQAAALVQAFLQEAAAALGFGGSEVFPKQTQLLVDRGDLGNWLNMPYFSGDKTDRYGVKSSGSAMALSEFLREAESKQSDVTTLEIKVNNRRGHTEKDKGLEDGPPCLQHLCASGFPQGTRNNGLFALGTFCMKKYGEDWKSVLESFNQKYMNPPLPSEEVVAIQRNLEKKEFQYRCKDAPINAHCNSTLCRTRRFGVGGGESFPVLTGLSVLETDPPLWFADVGTGRVELNTDQLQNYRLFQKQCMERLHVCFLTLKNDTWHQMVGDAMQTMVRIEASPEASIGGYFMELLEEFCVNRHRAESKEGLLQGKPWEDEESKRHYFRLSDFMQHLERAKFTAWGRNKVSSEVKRLGGSDFFNVDGKGVRVLWVKADFTPTPASSLPKRKHDPI